MNGVKRLSKWAQHAAAVAFIVAACVVGQPVEASARTMPSGSCQQGKENGGPWHCCSCEIEDGETRDYVVSHCQSTSQNGFASCQDGTDESAPKGTCSGSCEAGTS